MTTSTTPMVGKKSSKGDALAKLAQCRASIARSPWKLDRAKVYDRLEKLVNDHTLVDQDGLNLCGPAAFLTLWLARDPLAVVEFADTLYDTGKSSVGGKAVKPDSDSLIAENYGAIKAAYEKAHPDEKFTPEAEWMIMGSLRDAENWWFDFEGKPEEVMAAGTTPRELADWLEAAKLYSTVKRDANFFITKGLDHAKGLKPGRTRDVTLLINAYILTQMNVSGGKKKSNEFILSAFPNHFVVLISEIKEVPGGKLKFDCWSWGRLYSGTIDEPIFDANYYGAVTGDGAP